VKVPGRPKHTPGKHRHWKLIVGRQHDRPRGIARVRVGARRVRIRPSELDRFLAAGEPD
jgi:hypothetical protein